MSTTSIFPAARVQRAIDAGYRKYQPARDIRNYAMREWAGAWYGQLPDLAARGDADKRPVNLLHQFVQAYLYPMVGESLAFRVKPKRLGLRAEAKIRELMLNHRAAEIGLLETHRQVVMDALMAGRGIYIVGTGESGDRVRFRGETFDPGEFFAGRVDLDDYAADPNSRDVREDTWRAHRYRTTKDALHAMFDHVPADHPIHDQIENLPALTGQSMEHPGESHEIGGDTNAGEDRVFDEVELWDVTLYRGKTAYRGTLSGLSGGDWLVEPTEYMGYEGGPYVLMGVEEVPNNTIPLSPAGAIMDLHIAMARMGTKAVRQMLRARRATFYKPVEEEAVIRLSEMLDDDEFVKCQEPANIRTEEYGGLSQSTAFGFEWIKQESNNATNNMQQGRGVSGDASTATEASYLQANMTRVLSWMRARSREALNKVGMHMAWDLDTNLLLKQTFTQRLPGGNQYELVYDGSALEGDFTEFSWEISPYDEPAGDRNMELARFTQMLQTLGPAVQAIAGVGGDVATLVRIIGEKFNVPELDEILPDQGVMQVQQVAAAAANPGKVSGVRPPVSPGRRPIDQTRSDMAAATPSVGYGGRLNGTPNGVH